MPDATLAWLLANDPRQVVFRLSRYKFAAKMLSGYDQVLEIGCGNGIGSLIVAQHVAHLTASDPDIAHVEVTEPPANLQYRDYDVMRDPLFGSFDAVYLLDVFEHIADERQLLYALRELAPVCLIGAPTLQSQQYASVGSRLGHVNCPSGELLRAKCRNFWSHVFMFGMNDEVVHTGYLPMAQYVFALCVGRK